MSDKRPFFIWFLGIAMMIFALVALAGVVAGITTGGIAEAPAGVVVVVLPFGLLFGLLGLGLFTGKRIALIILKIVWVLWCLLLVFSFCAASAYAGGPNWGHGVGLILALLLSPIWSASVGWFCTEKVFKK